MLGQLSSGCLVHKEAKLPKDSWLSGTMDCSLWHMRPGSNPGSSWANEDGINQ